MVRCQCDGVDRAVEALGVVNVHRNHAENRSFKRHCSRGLTACIGCSGTMLSGAASSVCPDLLEFGD